MGLNDLKAVSLKIADTANIQELAGYKAKYVTNEPIKFKSNYIVLTLSDRSIIWPLYEVESVTSEDVVLIDDKYFPRYGLNSEYWEPTEFEGLKNAHYLRTETIYNETYIIIRWVNKWDNYQYKIHSKVKF